MCTITTESGDPPAMLSHSLSWLNICRSDMGDRGRRWSVVSLASSGYTTGATDSPASLSVSWVVVEGVERGGRGKGREWRGAGGEWRGAGRGKRGSVEGREGGREGGREEGREGVGKYWGGVHMHTISCTCML